MSTTYDSLHTHFRQLDDAKAAELIEHIADRMEARGAGEA